MDNTLHKKVNRKCHGIFRSSHQTCFIKKAALTNFSIFTGKHMCWSFFLNNLTCNFLKKRLQHRCVSVNIPKLLKTPVLKNIYQGLLLVLKVHYLLPKFNQHYVKTSHYSLIPLR